MLKSIAKPFMKSHSKLDVFFIKKYFFLFFSSQIKLKPKHMYCNIIFIKTLHPNLIHFHNFSWCCEREGMVTFSGWRNCPFFGYWNITVLRVAWPQRIKITFVWFDQTDVVFLKVSDNKIRNDKVLAHYFSGIWHLLLTCWGAASTTRGRW